MRSQLRDDCRTNTYTIQTKKPIYRRIEPLIGTREYSRRLRGIFGIYVNCKRIMKLEKVIRGYGIEVIIGNKFEIDLEILFRAIY